MVSTNNIINVERVTDLKSEAEQGKVTLTWTSVQGAEKYNIYRTNLEGQAAEKIGESLENTFIDETVVDGTRYYYYVTAVKDGGESEFSDSATALPTFKIKSINKPSSISDLTIEVGINTEEILVEVLIPGLTDDEEYLGKDVPNFEGRLIYYKEGTSKENASSVKLRYKEDGEGGSKIYYASFEPSEEGVYHYYAKGTTNLGDSYVESEENQFTANMVYDGENLPNSPVLKDILVESNRVQLEWTSDFVNVEGFEIYRKEADSDFVKIAVVDKTETKYTDFTVNNDNNYTYKIAAFNNHYNRSESEEKVLHQP